MEWDASVMMLYIMGERCMSMILRKCKRKCSIKTKYYSTHAHQKQNWKSLYAVYEKGLLYFDVRVDKQFNFVLLKSSVKSLM